MKEYEIQILGELESNLEKAYLASDSKDWKQERIERLSMIVKYQKKKLGIKESSKDEI